MRLCGCHILLCGCHMCLCTRRKLSTPVRPACGTAGSGAGCSNLLPRHKISLMSAHARRNKGRFMPGVANIALAFMPLNHLMGRMAILQCMAAGGSTAFVRPPHLSCIRPAPCKGDARQHSCL